jgi:hypothetical protein
MSLSVIRQESRARRSLADKRREAGLTAGLSRFCVLVRFYQQTGEIIRIEWTLSCDPLMVPVIATC